MKDPLIGNKVKEIRPMTPEELEREGWNTTATVIVFQNGTILYASMDSEGNGPGTLFGVDKNNQEFGL